MKTYKFSVVLCAVLLLAAGCKDSDKEPVNPYVIPGNTPDPQWQVTVDNDMTSSMTVIADIPFAKSAGTLAAFIGDDCCGIAEYNDEVGLYWLYISPADDANDNVQLKFYSPKLKRIFVSSLTFRNDEHLGSVSAPYTPAWKVAN